MDFLFVHLVRKYNNSRILFRYKGKKFKIDTIQMMSDSPILVLKLKEHTKGEYLALSIGLDDKYFDEFLKSFDEIVVKIPKGTNTKIKDFQRVGDLFVVTVEDLSKDEEERLKVKNNLFSDI